MGLIPVWDFLFFSCLRHVDQFSFHSKWNISFGSNKQMSCELAMGQKWLANSPKEVRLL